MWVVTYSSIPPHLNFTGDVPRVNTFKMPPPLKKKPAYDYSLFKNNIDSNTEVLVEVTDDNIGQVLKKDKILACLCEALEIIPQFTSFTSAKGKEFIVIANATINEIASTLE